VRHLQPALTHDLVLKVQPGKNVIPETGETDEAEPPNVVVWIVDPPRNGGAMATVRMQQRASLLSSFIISSGARPSNHPH